MIKLSKTGWNNVLIFAVMAFILLINATHDNVYQEQDADHVNVGDDIALVSAQQVILALKVEHVITIERVGKNWRATPQVISGQALEQMMMSWQESSGELMSSAPDIDRTLALNVYLDIASQSQPLLLRFYATDQQLLVCNENSQQWLAMPIALYKQLFPQEIFTG